MVKKATPDEAKAIKSIGIIKFGFMMNKFWKDMCQPCKIKSIRYVKRNVDIKAASLCEKCRMVWQETVDKHEGEKQK